MTNPTYSPTPPPVAWQYTQPIGGESTTTFDGIVNIPGTLNVTGNLINTGNLTVDGNLTVAGTVTAQDAVLNQLSLPASTAASASFEIQPGVAPTTPTDGDIWTTSAGLFVQIDGATVGPLAAASGGGSAVQLLQKVVMTGTETQVVFNVTELVGSTEFTDLKVRISGQGTTFQNNQGILLWLNGDENTANYAGNLLYSFTSVTPSNSTNGIGLLTGQEAGTAPGISSYTEAVIADFNSSTFYKQVFAVNGSGITRYSNQSQIEINTFAWLNTAPVTSLTVNFAVDVFAGTTVSLYGIL